MHRLSAHAPSIRRTGTLLRCRYASEKRRRTWPDASGAQARRIVAYPYREEGNEDQLKERVGRRSSFVSLIIVGRASKAAAEETSFGPRTEVSLMGGSRIEK